MKIDKSYFENHDFSLSKLDCKSGEIGCYENDGYGSVLFELDSLERIGCICLDEKWMGWGNYYNAHYQYGLNEDGSNSKECYKFLCSRAKYPTALRKLIGEYEKRKEV